MRTANRIGTLLLGFLLVAAGLLVAFEAALVAAGRDPWLLPLSDWFDALTTTTAADGRFLTVSIVVAVVGLLLLAYEVRPWPPQLVAVNTGRSDEAWWVSRRSVEQRIAAVANHVTGVRDAHAYVHGGRQRWRLRLSARADAAQRDQLESVVRQELRRLDAPPDVGVNISLRRGRVT